jgi:hypothetical protein
MGGKHIDDLLNKLEKDEQAFLTREFLAPMVHGGQVHVKIAGVVCRLKVRPAAFLGWGVFRPASLSEAELARPATLAERQRYLNLFPLVRVILCRKDDEQWLAIPAHQGDRRFRFQGMIPVQLVEEGQLFEALETRFDGNACWFAGPDQRRDPATATYLRQALQEMIEPEKVQRPGLTAEERTAYALCYLARLEEERDRTEERLRQALAHAGADYRGYLEREDSYRVEYEVDGQRHISVLNKKDLGVQVAGICLTGLDRQFDLQSLVGVIREAQEEGDIVRVGVENQGMQEERYWRVHPPEQR